MENLKGWKTVAFNVLMPALLLLSSFSESELPDAEQVQAGLDAIEMAITSVWAIGNMILRSVSNTKIFTKEPL